MARTDLQVNFRIPAELKEKLEAAALKSGRSVTMELVSRLEETFAVDDKWEQLRAKEENLLAVQSMYRSLMEKIDGINEFAKIAAARYEAETAKEEAEKKAVRDKYEAEIERLKSQIRP